MIRPELQELVVGETVPTDPDGGFRVKVVEPGRALVLYIDQEIVGERRPAAVTIDEVAPGLALSGRFMQTATPPEFNASWAFVLDPIDAGQTRLVERFRAHMGVSSRASEIAMAELKRPNVAVKASALPCYTQDRYPYRRLHPYLRRVFDAFGPKRMFWGTDYSRLPCSYREAITMFTEEIPWFSSEDKAWIMGRGLCDWLGWELPRS